MALNPKRKARTRRERRKRRLIERIVLPPRTKKKRPPPHKLRRMTGEDGRKQVVARLLYFAIGTHFLIPTFGIILMYFFLTTAWHNIPELPHRMVSECLRSFQPFRPSNIVVGKPTDELSFQAMLLKSLWRFRCTST